MSADRYGRRQPRWEHRPDEAIPFWLRAAISAGLACYLAYALVHTALD
jgi:hypothetical protein